MLVILLEVGTSGQPDRLDNLHFQSISLDFTEVIQLLIDEPITHQVSSFNKSGFQRKNPIKNNESKNTARNSQSPYTALVRITPKESMEI